MRFRSYQTVSLLFLAALFFLCLISASFVHAAGPPFVGGGDYDTSGGAGQLENPLAFDSLDDVVVAILRILIIFAIPIIILFIIYAGFLYVTSRGNESTIEKAHYALLYAVIGGVIILGAEAILLAIQGTVNQLY